MELDRAFQRPFLLARHGESVANKFNRVAGCEWNVPLTKQGKKQAFDLALTLMTMENVPDIIYSSPVKRAFQTSCIIAAEIGANIIVVDDLREQHLGGWNRCKWADIAEEMMRADDPPQGEPQELYVHRIIGALGHVQDDMQIQGVETDPVIIAHGGLFYALAQAVQKFDGMKEIKNCGLYRYSPCIVDDNQLFHINHVTRRSGVAHYQRVPFSPA